MAWLVRLRARADSGYRQLKTKNNRKYKQGFNGSYVKKSQEKFKLLNLIIDNIWHGVLILNKDREIISINESLSSLFYLDKKEVIGKKTLLVFNNNKFEELIARTFNKLSPQRESIVFFGDEEIFLDIESLPVTAGGKLAAKKGETYQNDDNTDINIVILAKNITQEVEFSKLRSQFVANISHEMRTPLTSMKGYIETLVEGGYKDEKILRDYLVKSLKEANRLNYLIEDVLNLSKIEHKRNVLFKENINIVEIIRESIESLKYLADQNSNRISFSSSQDVIYYTTDAELFSQIAKNLIENSIFHAGRKSKLHISIKKDRGNIYLDFTDNGVGIGKDDLPYIFQRFYRGKSPFSGKRISSGLGLSIVKHIVDLHGGKIKVESMPGVKTSFKIILPGQSKKFN
ncbi:MAG: ATP-binding protein [Actinomycetota bacterium]